MYVIDAWLVVTRHDLWWRCHAHTLYISDDDSDDMFFADIIVFHIKELWWDYYCDIRSRVEWIMHFSQKQHFKTSSFYTIWPTASHENHLNTSERSEPF